MEKYRPAVAGRSSPAPRSTAQAVDSAAGIVTTGRQDTAVASPTLIVSANRANRGPNTSPGSRALLTPLTPHPFSPELAMPSTRNRWKARKNSTIGSSAITDIANIGPNDDWLDASTKDRSASVSVNLSGSKR